MTRTLAVVIFPLALAASPVATVRRAAVHDTSPPLRALSFPGAEVEQRTPGHRPPAVLLESFDGLTGRNPSDNSIAVGPNHIIETVNTRMVVYTKKGALYEKSGVVLHGPVGTNAIFAGFGGQCEPRPNGDTVVRYDQLAGRWLYVMPIFRRAPSTPGQPPGTFAMCYALSAGADPLGPYHRYEFKRTLFPDYPRPAVWPDGYYNPTSTGDDVIQKHACVADRARMLQGLPATEQCIIIDGANFLNNADLDGQALPPPGAPNIIMAAGGTQLKKILEDDGIFYWKFFVDWNTPSKTRVEGPVKIPVAPYQYLCGGQLTQCVPQPGTERRLDAQGDKIMQRLVYRNLGTHESIVALHSVNTSSGGGGVRWYKFRLDQNRNPVLYQQGTYAPEGFYRWMGSIAMDRLGNIGIGYSFGGAPNFPGQRFAARLAEDPRGVMTFRETVLVEGEASQTNAYRWEDYTTLAMDPVDDCTFWYVGDYIKKDAANYTTRIGAFRLPGCLLAEVSGVVFFDRNHNGRRDEGEPGLAGWPVEYTGKQSGRLTADAQGTFRARLPGDPAYNDPPYRTALPLPAQPAWTKTSDLGAACIVRSRGGEGPGFWTSRHGKALLQTREAEWRSALAAHLTVSGQFAVAYGQLRDRVRKGPEAPLLVTLLNITFGKQDGATTIRDPITGEWLAIHALIGRAKSDAVQYAQVFESLNRNRAQVTPADPSACPAPRGINPSPTGSRDR